MDEQGFDQITRAMQAPGSRRSLLGRLVPGALAGALGLGAVVATPAAPVAARSLERCLRRCNRSTNYFRRRTCRRKCRFKGAGNSIGQGGAGVGSVCSRNGQCDSGNCANISPGSGLGRCADCPRSRTCGSGRRRQCCVRQASCVDDICQFGD